MGSTCQGGPILVGVLAVMVFSWCFRVFGRGSGFIALFLKRPIFANGVFWGWGWGCGSPLAGCIGGKFGRGVGSVVAGNGSYQIIIIRPTSGKACYHLEDIFILLG